MKNKPIKDAVCLILTGFSLLSFSTKSQISPHINGGPKDFITLKGRTLVVELMEEDQKVVDKLTKKNKTDELNLYKNFISTYNADIKVAVDKYWTFNKKVEYKKKSELDDVIGKSEDYVIMFYRELGDIDMDFASASSLGIPVLAYNRSDRSQKKDPDYDIYLPPIAMPDKATKCSEWTYSQSSYNFAVREMQANIEYMIKTNKKYEFEEYACKMSDDNKCKRLTGETLQILKSQEDPKGRVKEMKDAYTAPFQFIDDKNFNDDFVSEASGKENMFILPWGLAKGSIGFIHQTSIVYMKVVIDCKTGDINFAHKPGMMEGEEMAKFVLPITFENMDKCKS
jgi:hypothetical protein